MNQPELLTLSHERFRRVDRAIFVRRVVADCLKHSCVQVADEGKALAPHRPLLEACCQYGADTDLAERDAILARREQIASLMDPEAAAAPWFTDKIEEDPDYPSGRHVRTATFRGGCVFLAHDKRGCAIHRASFEQGWDFHGTKPNICRLFPLSYESDLICISDDYEDYDCADAPGAPTLYRVGRDTLGALFGADLVAALDAVEASIANALGTPLIAIRARPTAQP